MTKNSPTLKKNSLLSVSGERFEKIGLKLEVKTELKKVREEEKRTLKKLEI